jgi:hypothetical protein
MFTTIREPESGAFLRKMIFSAVHHFLIEAVDQLDDEVLAWLQEAHRVGLQQHLRRVS